MRIAPKEGTFYKGEACKDDTYPVSRRRARVSDLSRARAACLPRVVNGSIESHLSLALRFILEDVPFVRQGAIYICIITKHEVCNNYVHTTMHVHSRLL